MSKLTANELIWYNTTLSVPSPSGTTPSLPVGTKADIVGNSVANKSFTGKTIHDAITELSGNGKGRLVGVVTTKASIVTTFNGKPVVAGDFAILKVDDGANEAGFYVYDGVSYVYKAPLGSGGSTVVVPSANI